MQWFDPKSANELERDMTDQPMSPDATPDEPTGDSPFWAPVCRPVALLDEMPVFADGWAFGAQAAFDDEEEEEEDEFGFEDDDEEFDDDLDEDLDDEEFEDEEFEDEDLDEDLDEDVDEEA